MDASTGILIGRILGHGLFLSVLLFVILVGLLLSYQWFNHVGRPLAGVIALCVYTAVSATLLTGIWSIVGGVV